MQNKMQSEEGQPWFVWWRDWTSMGLGAYSPLHRTRGNRATLCGELIKEPDEKADRVHVGVRITKREPRRHALKVCARCQRKAAAKKTQQGRQAA
jgi:hypothetical protein